MKNNQKIIIAASLVATAVAFIFAKRKAKKNKPTEFMHFKKSRHLTPFAYIRKHH